MARKGAFVAESSKFKVSIWREFAPQTAILLQGADNADGTLASPMEYIGKGSGLQSEVYTWRMFEDAFGGIVDPAERDNLEGLLLGALKIDAPPTQRDIRALWAFIEKAAAVISAGKTEWTDSESAADDAGESFRLNPLIALVSHLRWLANIFDEQPNVSVTVR